MRRLTWLLLLLFVFTIPWEYSFDLGAPLGNAARIAGLLLLLTASLAVLQAGRIRRPALIHIVVLALFLWFCLTCLWSIDTLATLVKIRGYIQEMMIVWLLWEFAETPRDLRLIFRVWIAGCWVLAMLTVINFSSPEAMALDQYRFAPYGQDPNDVARFLDFGFPLAALLAKSESRWPGRLLASGYLPMGFFAVLLTASRGGFMAAIVAWAGCAVLLARGQLRAFLATILSMPAIGGVAWLIIPHEVFERLATIPQQLHSGDLNQRLNIWAAGWSAFNRAPIFGSGAGTFVNAARLAPMDTAHNTALSIAVTGGLCALFLGTAILVLAVRSVFQTRGSLRIALCFLLLVWVVTSLVATVEESRTTWLLFAVTALAGRLAIEDQTALTECFPEPAPYQIPAIDGNCLPGLSFSPGSPASL